MQFTFSHYKVEPSLTEIKFYYLLKDRNNQTSEFVETIHLPESLPISKPQDPILKKLLESLHLILGLSYYKTLLPEEIHHPYQLSPTEANYFSQTYTHGLGELFFKNNLVPHQIDFPNNITTDPNSHTALPTTTPTLPSSNLIKSPLLAFGGGKDSLVSLEMLRDQDFQPTLYFIETSTTPKYIYQLIKQTGCQLIKVKRYLDPQILNSSAEYYSGHVPISAIYAHIGTLLAYLHDSPWVIASNEQSANEGNVEYHHQIINHQWSKSSTYEELYQNYLHQFISPNITYFSILRPFNELRLAHEFVQYDQYHHYFSSCNRQFSASNANHSDHQPDQNQNDQTTSTKNRWCGDCPKCAFTFLLLAAWMPKTAVVNIFGEDLLDKKSLHPLYQDLLGLGDAKPFECVGTFAESKAALLQASHQFTDSYIVHTFLPLIKSSIQPLAEIIHPIASDLIPTPFKLCGMNTGLILGYGREGQSTESYLQQQQPQLELAIADQLSDPHYLSQQHNYDIGFKTPGISKKIVKMHYTTATNWYFAHSQIPTIGITGSKGKSTTATLIHHILHTAGIKTRLLGNIGTPMLEELIDPTANDINVVELSSYQLDDCHYSPHIAVVTSLFPEHLDYHESLDAYYQAKRHIISHQLPSDHFIYPESDQVLTTWASDSISQVHPIKIDPNLPPHHLLGQHNASNISLAIAVSQLFNVTPNQIAQALSSFQPLAHRLQFVGTYNHIDFYDDAISTTPESTIAAIKALPKTQTLFLGGQDRGYNFQHLGEAIKQSQITNIVLFPNSGTNILPHLNQAVLQIHQTDSMQSAVKFAYQVTQSGHICLLSCASPSYSLWKNFEHKGDEFQKWVKELNPNQ